MIPVSLLLFTAYLKMRFWNIYKFAKISAIGNVIYALIENFYWMIFLSSTANALQTSRLWEEVVEFVKNKSFLLSLSFLKQGIKEKKNLLISFIKRHIETLVLKAYKKERFLRFKKILKLDLKLMPQLSNNSLKVWKL